MNKVTPEMVERIERALECGRQEIADDPPNTRSKAAAHRRAWHEALSAILSEWKERGEIGHTGVPEEILAQRRRIDELEGVLAFHAQSAKDSDAHIRALAQQRNDAERSLAEARERISALEAEHATLVQALIERGDERHAAEMRVAALEADLAQLTRWADGLVVETQRLQGIEGESDSLKLQRAKLNAEIERLKAQLHERVGEQWMGEVEAREKLAKVEAEASQAAREESLRRQWAAADSEADFATWCRERGLSLSPSRAGEE